jgi:hypothetical protein
MKLNTRCQGEGGTLPSGKQEYTNYLVKSKG